MAPIEPARAAFCATLFLTGLLTGGLLIGLEPVGGDPDTMYRPIKMELANALRHGTLPFWSDRFGVGVPLVAESHAAAFYPPNWLFYRAFSVHAAYRLTMWLHYLVVVGGMFAYARILGLGPWGSALAALAFTFCGFQASHAIHEPFYHALAYLPLALIATERYVETGRLAWLVGIAACWGVPLSLGHFQLQTWTGGLVLYIGTWRIVADRRPWWRAIGLLVALTWGAAIAAVQLGLTRELVSFAGFNRETRFLLEYALPWQHWAQLAFPHVFMRLTSGIEDPYWAQFHTNEVEACFYVGVIPLILAILGLWGSRGVRTLRPWLVIGVAAFVLATMPLWWPAGYEMVLKLPGIGLFRCPGRYTMLTSLALCLYAGRGVDIITGKSPIGMGLILAALTAILAGFWIWRWAAYSGLGTAVGEQGLRNRMLEAAFVWCVGLALVAGVRAAWLPPATLVVAAALELGWLYYTGPTVWGWALRLPDQSPILTRLRHEDGVQLVAGPLHDLPVQAGLVPAFPYLGIPSPPNNYLFDTVFPERTGRIDSQRWMRRFGVSHGVWEAARSPSVGQTVYEGPDQALDRIIGRKPGSPEHRLWRIVRYPEPLPPAHVTVNAGVSATWSQHLFHLDRADLHDAWYLRRDAPREGDAPSAKNARLLSWDGVAGEVEHDGTCDLIIRRAFYPGWTALVDGRDAEVHLVNGGSGGLQAIRLYGAGRSRVSVRYHPLPLRRNGLISLFAAGLAAIVVGVELLLYHHRLASRPSVDLPG